MISHIGSIWFRAIKPGFKPDEAIAVYQRLLSEDRNPSLGKSLMWILVSSTIAYVIQGELVLQGVVAIPTGDDVILTALKVIFRPLLSVFIFLIISIILYAIARSVGGKANLDTQSYLLAAIQSPTIIVLAPLVSIRHILPFTLLLSFIMLVYIPLVIYALWLYTLALRAAHGYSSSTAWTIFFVAFLPAYIVGLILGLGA